MYYPCSENKGADQLHGYLEADLHLCFRICKKLVSHDEAHFNVLFIKTNVAVTKVFWNKTVELLIAVGCINKIITDFMSFEAYLKNKRVSLCHRNFINSRKKKKIIF